MGKYLLSK